VYSRLIRVRTPYALFVLAVVVAVTNCDGDSDGDDETATDTGFPVDLYMDVDATTQEVEAVRSALSEDPELERLEFCDETCAYDEFRRLFVDTPEVIAGTEPDDLPVSFRLVPKDRLSNEFVERFQGLAGVDDLWPDGAENLPATELYFVLDATTAQVNDVLDVLADEPEILRFEFCDRECAWERFQRLFADDPALIASTTPDDLPMSVRVFPYEGPPDELVRHLEMMSGVDEVRVVPRSSQPTEA